MNIIERRRTDPAQQRLSHRGYTRWLDKVEHQQIESAIESVLHREKRKMLFLLTNSQVWLQQSPEALPIVAGDKVTVKLRAYGDYTLHTQTGISTRVRRVQ